MAYRWYSMHIFHLLSIFNNIFIQSTYHKSTLFDHSTKNKGQSNRIFPLSQCQINNFTPTEWCIFHLGPCQKVVAVQLQHSHANADRNQNSHSDCTSVELKKEFEKWTNFQQFDFEKRWLLFAGLAKFGIRGECLNVWIMYIFPTIPDSLGFKFIGGL